MNATNALSLILVAIRDFGGSLLLILLAIMGIIVGVLIVKVGLNLVWHADGTTNWLGRHWSWYDQRTYSPYKGYKRWRSRKWNMKHMPDGM